MNEKLHLIGGYKIEYDVVGTVSKIKTNNNEIVWSELWENLYHQGDIGTASLYFTVLISGVIEKFNLIEFNPIGLVVSIELARKSNGFEVLPAWIEGPYNNSIKNICLFVSKNLIEVRDPEFTKCSLALLALNQGLKDLGSLIYEVNSGDEGELLNKYFK